MLHSPMFNPAKRVQRWPRNVVARVLMLGGPLPWIRRRPAAL